MSVQNNGSIWWNMFNFYIVCSWSSGIAFAHSIAWNKALNVKIKHPEKVTCLNWNEASKYKYEKVSAVSLLCDAILFWSLFFSINLCWQQTHDEWNLKQSTTATATATATVTVTCNSNGSNSSTDNTTISTNNSTNNNTRPEH